MDAATERESVAAFVESVLEGTGWTIEKVRERGTRFEPPDWFWTSFAVRINKDEERRDLRLVAKGALNPDAWSVLSERLDARGAGLPCDPIAGVGYPVLFPETQHAYWFYPYDPRMPNLPAAADPRRMAAVLFGLETDADPLREVEVERVRYVPEVGAILCYTIDVGGVPAKIYGKVQPGHRGLRTYKVVEGLWRAAERYPGYLHLPRPLAYVEDLGLLIEEGVKGSPIGNKRTSAQFDVLPMAAAEALAVIHESGLDSDERLDIEAELGRLDKLIGQFAYVFPNGHFLLKDLVVHMRQILRKTSAEDRLPTHGDLKYDQFIYHNDTYTLLDFDYFAVAETSYDLGKFCAYLIPSHPRDWRDAVAAEEARVAFVRRYRELRPHATLQRFGVYEALQLALRAMSFMWAQVPGWERIAEIYLVMAFERLKSRLPE
jgi:hypothetical protein